MPQLAQHDRPDKPICPSVYKVLTMVHLPSAPQHYAKRLLHHVFFGRLEDEMQQLPLALHDTAHSVPVEEAQHWVAASALSPHQTECPHYDWKCLTQTGGTDRILQLDRMLPPVHLWAQTDWTLCLRFSWAAVATVDWESYIDATVAGPQRPLSWTVAAAFPDLRLAAVPLLDLALHMKATLSKQKSAQPVILPHCGPLTKGTQSSLLLLKWQNRPVSRTSDMYQPAEPDC